MDITKLASAIDGGKLELLSEVDFLKHLPLLGYEIFGNSLYAYALTAASFFALWGLLRLARRLLVRKVTRSDGGVHGEAVRYAAALGNRIWPGVFPLAALYLALRRLSLPGSLDRFLQIGTMCVVAMQACVLASELASYVIRRSRLSGRENDTQVRASTQNLVTLARLFIWGAGILFMLDNAGVNISTFVAGLGIGGVAIALAAQAILGDTFSSFAIAMDRPFEVGDFIAVDGMVGAVEQVGFKTTRVRSLSGEMLVFANSDLTKSRIRNFQKMRERRVPFNLGVTYQTTVAQLRAIPAIVKAAVESEPKLRFDRCHFVQYGDSALTFEAVFWVQSPDYLVYVDALHAVNLRIFEAFAAQGIEFAYPTRTLHVVGASAPASARELLARSGLEVLAD
jgi:small-conductance mechanosensitive channel